jgi:hypothetical protein
LKHSFLFSSAFLKKQDEILEKISTFKTSGVFFVEGQRNAIKLFEVDGETINIKSFKVPHFINKIAYQYFRKSKAKRSFEYATQLLAKGIGTPQPIAYFENYDVLGLKDSYYVSEHLSCDLTFRELVEIPDYPDHENVLRQFTQFCFDLHENGVEFLDHSPGNTLIQKQADGKYAFYLVDLNRMQFHTAMDFDTRMKNLSHLTPKKEMIVVMSEEYAKFYAQSQELIFEKMWFETQEFQHKFAKKQRLKKQIKFWKK